MNRTFFLRWWKRLLLWPAVAVGVLVVSGRIYQAVTTARDRRTYSPPGRMVDIGDRRLHLLVTGENEGRPTVILEAGMATFSSNWYWI